MGNKRISDLNSLNYNTISADDLFYIVDISLPESKNITAGNVAQYVLNNGNITGSLCGSSSYANVAGYALNAQQISSVNYATSSLSASYASSSLSASYASSSLSALSSSYAKTASYAMTSIASTTFANTAANLYYDGSTPNGTASYAVSSSYLVYNPSVSNGSSSYSATSSVSTSSSYALTSYNSTNASLANASINASYATYVVGYGGYNAPQVVAAMSGNTGSIFYSYNVNPDPLSAISASCITMSFTNALPNANYYVSVNLSTTASYNMAKSTSTLYIPITSSNLKLLTADIIIYQ